MKDKKFLYCPKCKEYPDKIEDTYRDPITEKRKWYEGCYELQDTNINEVEYEEFCGKCGTKLIFREQKTDEKSK